MNSRKTLLTICFVIVGVFAFVGQSNSKSNSSQPSVTGQQATKEIPEYVRYMFLFAHHHFNMKKAAELEKQGKDGSKFHSMFEHRAGLSDEEGIILDQVTSDCEQALAQQDAKAQAVIDAFRSRYPIGDLPAGVSLPPPPPELTTMQEERNAIILRARDRLHAEFGDAKFNRFDTFVKSLGDSITDTTN